MSSYTTELRYICESLAGYDRSKGYMSIDEILDKSWNKIFPPSFEAFEESYTPVLAKKILKYYYTREIGSETFGLFQLRLDAKLSVIMPYYNKIYSAFAKDYDILHDVDVTAKHTKSTKGDNTTGTTGTNSNTNEDETVHRYSKTPQGGLDGLRNDRYLSSADITNDSSKGTNNSKVDSKGNFTTTEEYVESITGKRTAQSYASLISEYAEKLKNVDRMVINELDDLFMQVWDWGCFDGEE